MKVILDREKCIGCGSCVSACSEHWEMAEDGKVNLKDSKEEGDQQFKEMEEVGCNKQAANLCPTQAIKIEE